jgi:hypothetical protein
MLRDPEFGPIRIRAFGTYTLKAVEPKALLQEVVGTNGEFGADDVNTLMRSVIQSTFADLIGSSQIAALDLASNYEELAGKVREKVVERIDDEYGLDCPQLFIVNISFPESVEKALDTRTSMGVLGDMNRYQQYQMGQAMTSAAESGGGNKGGFTKPSFVKKVGTEQKDSPKKNGNGANNSPSGQPKNDTQKPKQSAKTADDLKDIIANMAGTTDKPKLAAKAESTKEAPVKKIEPATNVPKLEPKPTADKPPEPKSEPTKPIQPKEVAKPTPSPKPTPSDRVPAANSRSDNKSNQNQNQNQSKTTPDDLRAILAQMTNKTNEAKARAEAAPPNNRAQRPANNAARTNNHKPADLNQALKGVVKDRNQPNPNNHSARNTQPNQRADTRERTPAPHQPSVQKGNLKTTLAKVVAETNQANQAAEAKVASTAPIEQSSFGGIRQPAYVPHEQSSTPDINTAKKILRHSGKERPPGT